MALGDALPIGSWSVGVTASPAPEFTGPKPEATRSEPQLAVVRPARVSPRLAASGFTTPVEPKVLEFKFYARGVGPVLELTASGGSDRDELVSFHDGK
jgi:hypothetical protein